MLLGNSLGVAVEALHKVNVVGALGGLESGVHCLHIEAAIGEARVAGGAGGARAHGVIFVAGKATEAFVNARGSAVVARMQHPRGIRPVTLVAERLPRVVADFNFAVALAHRRQGQVGKGDGLHLSAIEQRDGRQAQFLRGAGRGLFRRPGHGIAVMVNHMAVQADNHRPIGKLRVAQLPRPLRVDGRHQIANAAVVVRAVAAEAVIYQETLVIVLGIEEYFLIRCVVQPGPPLCPLLLMAGFAAIGDAENVACAQSYLFRHVAAEVVEYPPHIVDVEPSFQREDVSVTIAAGDVAVG